jgi:hypothetical protein
MLGRVLEYAIVVILALLLGFAIGYVLWGLGGSAVCTDCQVSMPQVRAECDKQFFGTGVRAKQLEAGAEDEFLVAYADQSAFASDPNASGGYGSGGYSSPSGYPGVSQSTPAPRGPGYVMVRAQPQFGYNYSGGQSANYGSYDTTNSTRPGTSWNEVTVTVARYVNALRNEATCNTRSVRFLDGRFESYCEMPNRFGPEDSGQASYRIFVRNESSVPVEYCIISNCDASAPYGQGSLCQGEQAPGQ